jgi:ribonuclease HI
MRLSIYTDGGCSGNPGPGGWAYVIVTEGPGEGGNAPQVAAQAAQQASQAFPPSAIIAEQWGAEPNTTNNRMELSAVIAALESSIFLAGENRSPERITVYTDSQYVQKGITQWIHSWKRNNWRTSGKEPVKNKDLWQRLDELSGRYPLSWAWVKGHAGNEMNERCDQMTQEAIQSIR